MSVPCAVHSEREAIGKCAICERPVCDLCGQRQTWSRVPELRCPVCAEFGLPWERRRELELVRAYLETVRGALFEPTKTFKTLPASRGYADPLLYDLITQCIAGTLPAILSAMTFQSLPLPPMGGFTMAQIGHFLLWTAPLTGPMVVLFDFFLAAILHACLRFTGEAQGRFDRTYAATVYGFSPDLLNVTVILPTFLIPQLWATYTVIAAVREAHRITPFKAASAVIVSFSGLTLLGLIAFAFWFKSMMPAFPV